MTVTSTTATTTTTSPTDAGSSSTSTAATSLAGNLNDFLKLLMVQLQNQDPTSPMDTNQFTSQLVQYASVEQQINTNSNLTTLITATQSNTMLQSSALVGKQVTVSSTQMPLQNGTGTLHFTAPQAEPIDIAIYNAAGVKVLQTSVSATAGNNDWTWNGQDSSGRSLNDGAYKIVVTDSSASSLATTVTGTVTGVGKSGSSVNLSLGAVQADVSTIQTVNTGS